MKHLKIGDQVPDFKSKDQDGKEVSLKDYKGSRLVIYFYPRDNTPGCTTQACNLRDNYAELQQRGIALLGVSADNEKSHTKFISRYHLPFTLLADTDKSLLMTFGVWGQKKFMGRTYDGIHRTTFVMDSNHKIIGIIEKPKTRDHTNEILEIYKKNETGT